MTWLAYAASGAFGGLAVEAVQLLGVLDKTRTFSQWLTERRPHVSILSGLIRIGLGGGTAIIMASTSQINGPFGAF
jgi:hypothetical protein